MTKIKDCFTGKAVDTNNIPADFSPIFCAECGIRLGWMDESYSDDGVFYCDLCAAEQKKEKEYE